MNSEPTPCTEPPTESSPESLPWLFLPESRDLLTKSQPKFLYWQSCTAKHPCHACSYSRPSRSHVPCSSLPRGRPATADPCVERIPQSPSLTEAMSCRDTPGRALLDPSAMFGSSTASHATLPLPLAIPVTTVESRSKISIWKLFPN